MEDSQESCVLLPDCLERPGVVAQAEPDLKVVHGLESKSEQHLPPDL